MTSKPIELIYSMVANESSFRIIELQQSGDDPASRIYENFGIEKCWVKVKENNVNFDFYISLMILLKGEFSQRKTIKSKLAPKSINIKFWNKTIHEYLEKVMETLNIPEEHKLSEIKPILDKAFLELKNSLGFPPSDPFEHSYLITDTVIAKAESDENCSRYLKGMKTENPLTPEAFKKIKTYLNEKFPEKAEAIIATIQGTESREHLSIFSIDTDGYNNYVHMVSPDGSQIKMESWKFLLLIEKPNIPRQLYDCKENENLKNKYYKQHKFAFNNTTEGITMGRFNQSNSQFQIINYKDAPNNPQNERAFFIVDSTYVLCIYVVLKKLQEDRVKFTKMQEIAETQIENKNIFDTMFHEFN